MMFILLSTILKLILLYLILSIHLLSWIIATNKDIDYAISNYSYRFSTIEFLFKNQKSNDFHIEKISNASLKAFTNMYTICCIAGVTKITVLLLIPIELLMGLRNESELCLYLMLVLLYLN